MQPMPENPDDNDLDEVDELVDDGEFLPRADEGDKSANVKRIDKVQADELKLSHDEVRGRFVYFLSAAVGSSKPWQAYTFDAGVVVRPDQVAGAFAGGGPEHLAGIVDEKSYDLKLSTRSAGGTWRYFFHKIEGLSVETLAGYSAWDGNVTPHGSDDVIPDEEDKLTSSFHATGAYVGVSGAITWLWDSGLYLEWTLCGATKAKVFQIDYSRNSEPVKKAVENDLERASFYGLNNFKVGMFF